MSLNGGLNVNTPNPMTQEAHNQYRQPPGKNRCTQLQTEAMLQVEGMTDDDYAQSPSCFDSLSNMILLTFALLLLGSLLVWMACRSGGAPEPTFRRYAAVPPCRGASWVRPTTGLPMGMLHMPTPMPAMQQMMPPRFWL